jgi:two-component system nitrate/nitrite response regulator NarL
MQQHTIKILLADDHHVFRDGIRALLENERDFEVVGEAANGEEVLTHLKKMQPDILLLDIDMPEMSGLDLMKLLTADYAEVPVLILSSHDNEEYILHMMRNGAKGYILKSCRKDELMIAIKIVSLGNSYLSKEVSDKLIYSIDKQEKNFQKRSETPLTKREIEIIKLVAKGLTNQEIGNQLFISHRTVDTHRRNMMTKLDLHNAAALTNYAAQNGLLADD